MKRILIGVCSLLLALFFAIYGSLKLTRLLNSLEKEAVNFEKAITTSSESLLFDAKETFFHTYETARKHFRYLLNKNELSELDFSMQKIRYDFSNGSSDSLREQLGIFLAEIYKIRFYETPYCFQKIRGSTF